MEQKMTATKTYAEYDEQLAQILQQLKENNENFKIIIAEMLPDTIRQCKRNVFHHCSDEVDKSNIVEFVNRSDVTECLINRLMETDIARFNYETSDNKTKTTYKEFITQWFGKTLQKLKNKQKNIFPLSFVTELTEILLNAEKVYTDWTIDANENDLASYLCEVCDRRLKTKKGLNQHLMAIHSIKRRSNLDSMNEDEFERSHQIGVVPKKKPIRKVEKGRIGIKRSSKAKESEDDEEYKP